MPKKQQIKLDSDSSGAETSRSDKTEDDDLNSSSDDESDREERKERVRTPELGKNSSEDDVPSSDKSDSLSDDAQIDDDEEEIVKPSMKIPVSEQLQRGRAQAKKRKSPDSDSSSGNNDVSPQRPRHIPAPMKAAPQMRPNTRSPLPAPKRAALPEAKKTATGASKTRAPNRAQLKSNEQSINLQNKKVPALNLSTPQQSTMTDKQKRMNDITKTPKVRSKFLAGKLGYDNVSQKSKRALSNISGSYRGVSVTDHFQRSNSRIGGKQPMALPDFRQRMYNRTNLNDDDKNKSRP